MRGKKVKSKQRNVVRKRSKDAVVWSSRGDVV